MSETPEALRLADEYASDGWIAGTRQWCEEAAAELRRQHDEIEQLREQNTALDAACANLEAQRNELRDILAAMPWPQHHTGVNHLTDEWYEWLKKRIKAMNLHHAQGVAE